MELRRSFDEDALNYDRYRPGYPQALFDDVIAYSHIGAGSRLVEIGIGTGQATKPFLELGCRVTGIELGENLSAFVAEKFRDCGGFNVVNADFMSCPVEENSCDLIYCATAFHWLPKEAAYSKIMRSLKSGGSVALFWNHPFPNRDGDPSNTASKRVYAKFRPSGKAVREFCEEDCAVRVKELKSFGFENAEYRLYKRVRKLSTDEYIHLLNTYSDHRALEPSLKEAFESEMRKALDEVGGFINIYDTVDLYLAQKP